MVPALALFAVGAVVLAGASAQAAPEQPPSVRGIEARQATMRLASTPNQVVDIANASQDNGAKAIQWDLSGAPNQMWETEAALDGYYRFKSGNSGKCLNVQGASGADGAAIVQYTCGGAPNELWKPVRRAIGYQLVSKNTGKCLAVGGGVGTGHNLVQNTCSPGAANDVWLLVWEPPVTG
jgi:hypothetical protein